MRLLYLLLSVSLVLALKPVETISYDKLSSISDERAVVIHHGSAADVKRFTTALTGSFAEDTHRVISVDLSKEPADAKAPKFDETAVFISVPGRKQMVTLEMPKSVIPTRAATALRRNIDETLTYGTMEPDFSKVDEFVSAEDIVQTWQADHRPVFVAHTATWCGHCQAMKPDFAVAADQVPGVRFMTVDCPSHDAFCAENNAHSFPTLLMFDGAWHEFPGHNRSAPKLINFAREAAARRPRKWNGRYTITGAEQIRDDGFVEPAPEVTGAWKEVRQKALDLATGTRIIVFGDARDAKCVEGYRTVAAASAALTAAGVTHEVYRIEKRRGDEAFAGMESLPAVFIANDEYQPVFVTGDLTEKTITDMAMQLEEKLDYSLVKENPSGREIASAVRETGHPVLVAFKASWCTHCKALRPHWAYAAAHSKSTFAEILCDKDENKEACDLLRVRAYPTIFAFDGRKWTKFDGGRNAAEITEFAESVEAAPKMDKDAYVRIKIRNERIKEKLQGDLSQKMALIENNKNVRF